MKPQWQKNYDARLHELYMSLVVPELASADPSELALAIDQPAPQKPCKSIADMTLSDFRRSCDKVMRAPWLPY